MPDNETQVSGGTAAPAAPAVVDNPSPSAEGAEKGSTAAATVVASVVQEHRDLRQMWQQMTPADRKAFIIGLSEQDIKLHPGVHQYAKSVSDQVANRIRQDMEKQRERELIKADPLAYAEKLKEQVEQEDQWAPLYERARQEVEAKARNEGYLAAYEEQRGSLEELRQELGMAPADFRNLVDNSQKFGELLKGLVKHGVTRQSQAQVDAELKKLQARQEAAERLEEKGKEPQPDLGGGGATSSDSDFLAAFAAGRSNDFARAQKLLNH